MLRDIEVHNPTTVMCEDHQNKQHLVSHGWHHEEIDRHQIPDMIVRNAFHVGDGDLLDRTRYFSTVDLATSIPSLRSSPTIRGEPQLILASDILRINALISSGTCGLPGLPCLLNLAQ